MREPHHVGTAAPIETPSYELLLQSLAADLRNLRISRGNPTLAEISARNTHGRRPLSPSALSEAFNGKRLPGWEFYSALIRALLSWDANGRPTRIEHTSPDLQAWGDRWREVQRSRQRNRSPSRATAVAAAPLKETQAEPRWPVALAGRSTGRRVFALSERFTGESEIGYVTAFSSDGRLLAVSSGTEAQVWDSEAGQQMRTVPSSAMVTSLAFSSDGKLLAIGAADEVWVVDWASGQQVGLTLSGHTGDVQAVAISPVDHLVASTDAYVVRIWDLRRGKEMRPAFIDRRGSLPTLTFSPDGRYLGVPDIDVVRIWSPITGEEVRSALVGHAGAVGPVTFSPDGQMLASGSDDGRICLWLAATGEEARPALLGHERSISALAFSPDAALLATAAGGVVGVWNPTTGESFGFVESGHRGNVTGLAFSSNGTFLSTVSDDQSLRLHPIRRGTAPWNRRGKPEGEGGRTGATSVRWTAKAQCQKCGWHEETEFEDGSVIDSGHVCLNG